MNNTYDKKINERNKAHYYDGISKVINFSYNEGEDKYFEQIHFDNVDIRGRIISKIKMVDIDTGLEDEDNKNYVKYRINMVKIFNKYYNENIELTRFERAILIMKINNIKELRKISKGDKMLMKVVKKIEEISKNPDLIRYIDDEKAVEYGHMLDVKDAEKRGHESGYSEGASSKEKEIACNLLKKGIDIEIISETTGLSKEKIIELEK